ncbi:universal stress protein [Cryptosporangium arvum]|uniref:Universal stress protein UspA-like protein n=1 Tax=Cryptosporangium arvum DSM 44712 TaxID=927661 RepID=A0A010YQI4_9ACTN|nr:universal stress protein [Cryptosporangium arvum]EXG82455.1 universal stress protein UspA-like protein [Cryptosporangium arvum DSM 44712]
MTAYRKPIVVGVSPTDSANDVVAWGAREAQLRGRRLRLVHAHEFAHGGTAAPATARLAYRDAAEWMRAQRAYAARLLPGGELEATVLDGNWVEVLLHQASDAEMLVVGSGDEWRTDGLATARAVQLVAHADVPVIVVRGGGQPAAAAGRVVVGCGEGDQPDVLLAAAFDEADRRGVDLLVVRSRISADVPREADVLAGWRAKYPQVVAGLRVCHESPAAALIEASQAAGLVIVGSRGAGGFPGLRLGSVTDAVLRHAVCPVLVVPVVR